MHHRWCTQIGADPKCRKACSWSNLVHWNDLASWDLMRSREFGYESVDHGNDFAQISTLINRWTQAPDRVHRSTVFCVALWCSPLWCIVLQSSVNKMHGWCVKWALCVRIRSCWSGLYASPYWSCIQIRRCVEQHTGRILGRCAWALGRRLRRQSVHTMGTGATDSAPVFQHKLAQRATGHASRGRSEDAWVLLITEHRNTGARRSTGPNLTKGLGWRMATMQD